MKEINLICLYIFFVSFGINAQEQTCNGIDTTHLKRIKTIPIDDKCVKVKYSKSNQASPIGFYTKLKKSNNSDCFVLESYDLKNYNMVYFYSTTEGCGMPKVEYKLFDTGEKSPLLMVNITQYKTCKMIIPVKFSFLVSKKLCPQKPTICISRNVDFHMYDNFLKTHKKRKK